MPRSSTCPSPGSGRGLSTIAKSSGTGMPFGRRLSRTWRLVSGIVEPSAVDAAHAQVFDLKVVLDAVFRTLAADARLFHTAERRDLGRDDALVDADDAVFERLGDAPDAADVAAVEIGGEAEFGVVGHAYGLVVGLEAIEGRDRAKGFLFGDDHIGR